jgi:hypothetical protein
VASFADEWHNELERHPRLEYLHAKEAYGFKGQFARDKSRNDSPWTKKWGLRNRDARDERVERFANIIIKHLKNGIGEGITWMLKHDEYEQVFRAFERHPRSDPKELRLIKNPYYLVSRRSSAIW